MALDQRGEVARLEPWDSGALELLRRCVADPEMMVHLGGPEDAEKISERQARYEQPDSNQFKIIDSASGQDAGWVGFWEDGLKGGYEIGWAVVPGFQRRGLARSATRQAVEKARAIGKHRFIYAYPSVANAPSNAVCRSAGFELLGPREFEYPNGHTMTCNVWRLALTTE